MAIQTIFNDDSHFTLENIPFGVVSLNDEPKSKRIATRLHGDVYIIPNLISSGLLGDLPQDVKDALNEPTLNTFASLPRSDCRRVRTAIQYLLKPTSTPNATLAACKHPETAVINHLPVTIGDFTDFSCSMNHVLNASEAMTGNRSVPPCFLYYPPGYSGRCSSIIPSGTPIRRPRGSYRDESGSVIFGPSRRIDFELEVGAIIGRPTTFGNPVHISNAAEHIFGLVLINDWSARDIQALEMPPLGPLNGKSFGTSISPWIITLDALGSFACPVPPRDPNVSPAPYLQDLNENSHYAINTQASIIHSQTSTTICKSTFESLYWSLGSLVAHQTSNGCPLSTGDLLGTGTISGSTPGSYGCLLEATKGGKEPITLGSGATRTYLQDGDAVLLTAWAGELETETCVGFGKCFGTLEPAKEM